VIPIYDIHDERDQFKIEAAGYLMAIVLFLEAALMNSTTFAVGAVAAFVLSLGLRSTRKHADFPDEEGDSN